MVVLTREGLSKMEEYYYWGGNRGCVPFPDELKEILLVTYGEEPFPYTWSEQDIHEGARKIIRQYFND